MTAIMLAPALIPSIRSQLECELISFCKHCALLEISKRIVPSSGVVVEAGARPFYDGEIG
jgi:hypothetical protein